MDIRPVNPAQPIFTASCIRCGKRYSSDRLLADIEGKAFVDYYCEPCVRDLPRNPVIVEIPAPHVNAT